MFTNNAVRNGGIDPKTGGFKLGQTVNLGQVTNYLMPCQNDYYTKEICCRPGEHMDFSWHVDGQQLWKKTQELRKFPNNTQLPKTAKELLSPRFEYLYYKQVSNMFLHAHWTPQRYCTRTSGPWVKSKSMKRRSSSSLTPISLNSTGALKLFSSRLCF